MLGRKRRGTGFPITERRAHRADRAPNHDDPAQRRRDAIMRAAARQVDW